MIDKNICTPVFSILSNQNDQNTGTSSHFYGHTPSQIENNFNKYSESSDQIFLHSGLNLPYLAEIHNDYWINSKHAEARAKNINTLISYGR